MRNRVVITGVGVVSALGDSPSSLHFSLCSGRRALKPVELFSTSGLGCPLGGEIPSFDAQKYLGRRNLRPLDRTSRLVTSAAQLALTNSGWSEEMRNQEEVGLVLGTMFCSVRTISQFDRRALEVGPAYASPMDFSNTVINAAAGQTAIMHNLRGINSTISTGTTSGLQAIAYATEAIRSGRADAILAGGADELCFESFYGFDRAGLLCRSDRCKGDFPIPFDRRRNGLALGEGAAILMLENATFARQRGAHALGEITGHGFGYDCSQGEDEETSVQAIAVSIRRALNDAFTEPHEIDCFSASANGSYAGDRHEAMGVYAGLNGQTRKLPVTAIKSMLGETLGASGPIQAVALLETMGDGVLPGINCLEEVDDDFAFDLISSENSEIDVEVALINSVGLDGHCCSLVLAKCNEN
jgi:3-oxoacyl-[acyl-carrier-protein] synthase II